MYAQEYVPSEVIIISDFDHNGAPWARNRGAAMATCEFLFFCDDDVILKPDALLKLRQALEDHPEAAYAYGDYTYTKHPTLGSGTQKGQLFNHVTIKKRNYISTMSLIRASKFPGWNETVQTLQDHRLWLDMLESGDTGLYVPGVLFSTEYTDGVTTEAAKK